MDRNRFCRIYGIALSCALILAGFCLMAACVGIYRSGEGAFSREAVAAAFSTIAIPVFLCLFMILIGFVLKWIFPFREKPVAPAKQLSEMLRRAHLQADLNACGETLRQQILEQQILRKKQFSICSAALAGCAAVFLLYALNGSSYTEDINGSMIRAMGVLIPCLVLALTVSLWAVYVRHKSIRREIELLKQCPKKPAPTSKKQKNAPYPIRYVLLVAAIVLAALGFLSGGTGDVLAKAVNICTECIGLG